MLRRALTAAVLAVALTTAATPAVAAARPAARTGTPAAYDISYPQCGGAFPSPVGAGIVGVNDGSVYSANPCLGTGDGASELAWAQHASNAAPAFYANTASPGSKYSSHWPSAGAIAGSQTCTADASGSLDTPSCSYVYGWDAAQNSFGDAVTAEQQLNSETVSAATSAAAAAHWWLDVETGNSWQTLESAYGNTAASQANDTATLTGARDALAGSGVATVGFYSTSSQWTSITGTTGQFPAAPSWLAGLRTAKAAQSTCGTTGFTGGPVRLAQYPSGGYDADAVCP